MIIEAIHYPTALVRTDSDLIMDVNLSLISGPPRIGCEIERTDGGWKVVGNNADPDCVGGVCPIK